MNVSIPATSIRIITIVVIAIASDATIGILTLAYCMISMIQPPESLTTAFVGITSGLVGALTGLLINTRSGQATETTDKPTP